MSRIGRLPINIPAGVSVSVNSGIVTVKGKLGELTQSFTNELDVKVEDNQVIVSKLIETKEANAKFGLIRALIANMVEGVSNGFTNKMHLIGVGYRAKATNQDLELSLGFSHNVVFRIPKEVSVSADQAKGQPPIVTLSSHDKQLLGQVTSKLRSLRKPEPYKGKGIKFENEVIRRKAGKSAGKK
jgi:large subunit ribosomal protein L6